MGLLTLTTRRNPSQEGLQHSICSQRRGLSEGCVCSCSSAGTFLLLCELRMRHSIEFAELESEQPDSKTTLLRAVLSHEARGLQGSMALPTSPGAPPPSWSFGKCWKTSLCLLAEAWQYLPAKTAPEHRPQPLCGQHRPTWAGAARCTSP